TARGYRCAVRRDGRRLSSRHRAWRSARRVGHQSNDRFTERTRRCRRRRGRGDTMSLSAVLARGASRQFLASFPPFSKGRLGGIWIFQSVKSPSVPLFQRGIGDGFIKSAILMVTAIFLSLSLTPYLFAQPKPLKEIRVPYALGGSTSFFWVAQRSGSFEKYGLKVLPIFMRGGREAVQALISRDVTVLQQGSSGVILAWAQGAKDLVVLGATGNKLDYVFVSNPNIKKPADLKGKKVAISQL